MTRIWAIKADTPHGEIVLSETAVCDKHKHSDKDDSALLTDCSENDELECQKCGSRSTAYVLRTARSILNEATAEISALEELVASSSHGLRVIAMMDCNLAQMIWMLAKCVEQLANDQL